MSLLPVLPVIIPLLTAALSLAMARHRTLQRGLSLAGSAGLVAAAVTLLATVRHEGIIAVEIGSWPAPFGIVLVADMLSAIMVLASSLLGLSVVVYALGNVDQARVSFGFHPLFHALLMGVCGAFLTGDLFNLYVWFEVMLMASFVLLALGGEKNQLAGAFKYVTLNFIASSFFLTGIGLLYGKTGTLNMADLAQKTASQSDSGLMLTSAMLLFLAFGIKAAVFPLFSWLPASYHTPPTAVTAIFAALLTKVGVYALIRMFTLVFIQNTALTHGLILGVSAATMVVGVLGAAAHFDIRRILSFHIISQIGYMTLGLGFFTVAGIAGAIFYVVHNMIVKTNLFLAGGIVNHLRGTFNLKYLGGLYRAYPLLAFLFLVSALSQAGVPPLSGFLAKLMVIRAGLAVGEYALVAVALAVGILTLYSMTKIWTEAFWKEPPTEYPSGEKNTPAGVPWLLLAPVMALTALTIGLGLFPESFIQMTQEAAEQLMDRTAYIRAVLGPVP
ncbi:MAG: Na+/H+ antiporter subunit D [Acidobacteria bacterium]|nr:Na+/H+ antiporter subunit D [Acidobacteriota bacterium]